MARSLDELAVLLFDEKDLAALLDRVAGLASDAIKSSDMGGVALTKGAVVYTGGASEELVEQIDSFQFASGSGPSVTCMEEQRIVRVDRTSDSDRWTSFSTNAVGKGIGSVLAAPLVVRGDTIGCLTLYARDSEAFSSSDEAKIRLFARDAAVTLANARALAECRRASQRLRKELYVCDLLGRAAGVSMERNQLTAEQAHLALRRQAAESGMTLDEIARRLLNEPDEPVLG